MIWLSNSALRYAVDVCNEIPNYRAIVYVRMITHADDIKHKLRTYLKNTRAMLTDTAQSWHATYSNGSRLDVVAATDRARGRRCYLAIAEAGIDENIIDTVIRPAERQNGTIQDFHDPLDWDDRIDALPETFQTGGLVTDHTVHDEQNNGFTNEHERDLWENLRYTLGEEEIHNLAERIRTNIDTFEAYRETHNEDDPGFTITNDPLFPTRWGPATT